MTEFLQLINFDCKTLITWIRSNVADVIKKKRVAQSLMNMARFKVSQLVVVVN